MKIITISGPSGSGKSSLAKAVEYISKSLLDDSTVLGTVLGHDIFDLKVGDSVRHCIFRYLVQANGTKVPVIKEAVSFTTRKPRVGEVDGRDYNFVSVDEFNKLTLYESTNYCGNYYGLAKESLDMAGVDIAIAVVDQIGAKAIKKAAALNGDSCTCVFLKVSTENVCDRLHERGDSDSNIEARLELAKKSNEFVFPEADIVIDNQNKFYNAIDSFFEAII